MNRARRRRRRPVLNRDRVITLAAGAITITIAAGIIILFSAGAVSAYRYMTGNERLSVGTVRVVGNHVVDENEIREISGVRRGRPILDLDIVAAARNVENHPRIARAVVRRIMPRTIEIEVTERAPVALIRKGGEIMGLDGDGVVIPIFPSSENPEYPVITGPGLAAMEMGAATTAPAALEALRAIDLLGPDLAAEISEVRVGGDGDVSLITTGRVTVIRLGRGGMEEKIERLRMALAFFAERGEDKDYIDLRFDDLVTRP